MYLLKQQRPGVKSGPYFKIMEKDKTAPIFEAFLEVFGQESLVLGGQKFIFDNHKAILFSDDLSIKNSLEIAFSIIGRCIIGVSDQNLCENLETFKDYLRNDLKCTFEQADGHLALEKECSLEAFIYTY